jgi:hypothetical protein
MRLALPLLALLSAVHAQSGMPDENAFPFSGCVLARDLQTACVKDLFFFFLLLPLHVRVLRFGTCQFDTESIPTVCVSAFDQKSPCSASILDGVAATQRGLKVPCHRRTDACECQTHCDASLHQC